MTKLEYAPAACPRCGEKKEWAFVKTPGIHHASRSEFIVEGLEFGILGVLFGALIPLTEKVECHCWKCDYRNTFKRKIRK